MDKLQPLLDALSPPVEFSGWVVVVTDEDGGVTAVLGPHDDEMAAGACLDVIRLGPGRTGAVVRMRSATVRDIHDQVQLTEMIRASSVPSD